MSDLFGRNRIAELERQLKKSEERYDWLAMQYFSVVERRVRDLELHTGLVPLSPGIGTWKDGEFPKP